jgi:hypothetical protein
MGAFSLSMTGTRLCKREHLFHPLFASHRGIHKLN